MVAIQMQGLSMPLWIDTRVRELVASGDFRTAATEAIRHFGPEVLRYLRSLLRDEDAATDAFSHFAENLWKSLSTSTFHWEASLRTWAFRLATNAARDVRDEAWRRHRRPFATGEASRIAEEVRTRTAVRRERQRAALDKLRETLTLEENSLLALRIDRDLSWADIAEVLSEEGKRIEVAAMMKRFERLKDRLAKLAREQGLVD